MNVNVLAGQVPITWDIGDNMSTVASVLRETNADELLVLPEGLLSGYDDQLTGLEALHPEAVDEAIDTIGEMVRQRKVHLFCGTLLFTDGHWFNTAIYFGPEGDRHVYRKVNLATGERTKLAAGSHLPVYDLAFDGGPLKVSPQLCREVRFPDQWHVPARQGAQLFAYLTYATNPRESMDVWRSHLVSRAAETQRFVVVANVAHSDRHCPTMIVSPRGDVIAEALDSDVVTLRATLDTDVVSNWYVEQQRNDVIQINYRELDASVRIEP
jgi:predicted amidohydrolase